MKTVLIVEDETMIRKGIRVMIQRCNVPVENIIECSNGQTALEMLRQQAVDVMFTDIRMPHMDGIQLVNEVQKLRQKPLIVAISGYDDFSYAVEMMRNGVREYLLKPVEREKLTMVLQKLEEELENQKKLAKADQVIGKSQIRHLLLEDNPLAEEMEGLEQKYGDTFFPDGYQIAIAGSRFTVQEQEQPKRVYLQGIATQNVCIYDLDCRKAFLAEKDCLKEELCFGVSQTAHGIAGVRQAYKEALHARQRAYYTGRAFVEGKEERPHVPDAIRHSAQKHLEESAWTQKLHLIGTNKMEELRTLWRAFFTEAGREHIMPEEFERGMAHFLTELESVYHNLLDERISAQIAACRQIYAYTNVSDYEQAVMELINAIHEKIVCQEDQNGMAKKMQEAQNFIQENYNKDLNMAVVSNYLSINYSVFSCEFKNYTGMNFVTYLKELRMKEARKLLEETDKKIVEISQLVGYDNEKHFMKLFKAICGVSPSEYRKNMQHQKQET